MVQIKFFAIAKSSGETLLSINLDETLNDYLITSFLTAVYSFGVASLNEQMSKLTIESKNMRLESCYHKHDGRLELIALGFVTQSISHEQFQEFAQEILKTFCEEYYASLINWYGEVSQFDSFKIYLNKLISERFANGNGNFNSKLDDVFNRILSGDLSGINEI